MAAVNQPYSRRSPSAVASIHSPIILAYPGAVLYSLDGDSIDEIAYRETEHYLVTHDFLNAPERYLRHLFRDNSEEDEKE